MLSKRNPSGVRCADNSTSTKTRLMYQYRLARVASGVRQVYDQRMRRAVSLCVRFYVKRTPKLTFAKLTTHSLNTNNLKIR